MWSLVSIRWQASLAILQQIWDVDQGSHCTDGLYYMRQESTRLVWCRIFNTMSDTEYPIQSATIFSAMWIITVNRCLRFPKSPISHKQNITIRALFKLWLCKVSLKREREIKFIGLFGDRGHQGTYSPYKLCNHNLYIGIIIFPHIDNPQSTGCN